MSLALSARWFRLFVAAIVLVAGAAAPVLGRGELHQAPYTVPDFKGMTYGQVLPLLVDPHTHRAVFAHVVPQPPSAGSIVAEQRPVAGTTVFPAAGPTLFLVWKPAQKQSLGGDTAGDGGASGNTGPVATLEPLRVPNVTGENVKRAYVTLETAGFHTLRPHGSVAGTVVRSQRPAAGSMALSTQTIELYFTASKIAVPEVRNERKPVAEERLRASGLKAVVDSTAGWLPEALETVDAEDPLPGTLVAPNTVVHLGVEVSTGGAATVLGGLIAGLVPLVWWLRPRPSPASPRPPLSPQYTVVAQRGVAHMTLPGKQPAVRVALTLRPRPGMPRYGIDKQPTVTKVR